MIEQIRARAPWIWLSVSVTTRKPRDYEVDGEHYHFVDRPSSSTRSATGQLLEWAEFAGNLYGTPRGAGARPSSPSATPVLLKIDLQGARQVRDAMPEARWSSSPRRAWRSCKRRLRRPRHRRRGDDPPPAGARRRGTRGRARVRS